MSTTSSPTVVTQNSEHGIRKAGAKITRVILGELKNLDPDARLALLDLTREFLVDRLIESQRYPRPIAVDSPDGKLIPDSDLEMAKLVPDTYIGAIAPTSQG